jgi:hypothetical protein
MASRFVPADGGTLRVWLPEKKIKNKNRRMMRKTAGKKVTPMKKAIKKQLAKRKAAPKKAVMKTKAGGKKTTSGETAAALKKQVREKSQSVDTVAFAPEGLGPRSGE